MIFRKGRALALAALSLCLPVSLSAQSGTWQEMVRQLEARVANAEERDIRLSIGVLGLDGPHEGALALVGSPQPYPPASTIKMLLIATLMRQVDEGTLSLEGTATVTEADIVGGYGVLQDEPVPNEVPVGRLAELTVTISDNTATNVLVDVVGYESMQALTDELGLETMQFGRKMFESPLPPERENYIDAIDTIILLRHIHEGTFLTDDSRDQILSWMSAQTVTTKIAAGVPEYVPIAHKTGENASVSHDLGYLLLPGNEVALAIFAESLVSDDFDTVQAAVNPVVADVARTIHEHLAPAPAQSVRVQFRCKAMPSAISRQSMAVTLPSS